MPEYCRKKNLTKSILNYEEPAAALCETESDNN